MLATTLVLRAWRPTDDPSGTVCLFRRLTHHPCATCGMTRAMTCLARGDLHGAFAYHPLAPPLALELALLWFAAPLVFTGRVQVSGRTRDRWLLAHAGAFLLVWAVRLVI